MSFVLRYRPEVVGDLDEASRWYEDRRDGLGGEFLRECKAALDRIQANPEAVAADFEGIRSARVSRFPYVVHDRIQGQTVVVFGGRDSSEWSNRV